MGDRASRIDPIYLQGPRGALFCLHLTAALEPAAGAVIYLHPFAEEMHKSRRVAALQARALAHAGFAVLQVDLTGCGDSAGDFGDASWEAWRDDARFAHGWLTERTPGPVTLWGLRMGATLAVDVARELTGIVRLLLWQPVVDGDQFLGQFLRIKLASEMLSGGQAQSGIKALRARLEAGAPVEVGGYTLSSAMARDLAGLRLGALSPASAVEWMEVGVAESDDVAPAGRRVVEAWRAAGAEVRARTVPGEPFWATQEIAECPALLACTELAMRQ